MSRIIKFIFNDESTIFYTKGDICGFIKEEWFLSHILKEDSLEDSDSNTIIINEDKNTVRSLIDSLRYNRLIVYPDVSFDYLIALSEKWCLPDWVNKSIKERLDHNIDTNHVDRGIVNRRQIDPIDNIVFHCTNCKVGFRHSENKSTSCKAHPGGFHPGIETFTCCGRKGDAGPCVSGYHTLSDYTFREYLKLKGFVDDS